MWAYIHTCIPHTYKKDYEKLSSTFINSLCFMGIRPSCTHWTLSGVKVVFICIWYVSKRTKVQKRVQVYRFHRAKWAVCPVSSSCGRLQHGDWFCLWLCWWNGVSDSPLFIEGWVSHGSICTAWLVNAAQRFSFPGHSLGSYKGSGSVVKRFAALAERGPSFSS